MPNIPYINYKELEEFYTIPQICQLFEMSKPELREKCKRYDIEPRRNEIGDYGFVKYDVRKMHSAIYYNGVEMQKRPSFWGDLFKTLRSMLIAAFGRVSLRFIMLITERMDKKRRECRTLVE